MRLLVDHNLPPGVVSLLNESGFVSSTATSKGWSALTNGQLIAVAAQNGFEGIITKDIRLHLDGEVSLRRFPTFAIVIVRLPQLKKRQYLERFAAELDQKKLLPAAGKIISWPS